MTCQSITISLTTLFNSLTSYSFKISFSVSPVIIFAEILAIGIGHDVSRYYQKAIKITDVQELGDVMIGQLSGLFENKKKFH